MAAYPTDALALRVTAAYLDSEYKTFEDVPVTIYDPATGRAFPNVPIDATGLTIPGNSKFTLTADLSYRLNFASGSLTPNISYYHRSKPYAFPVVVDFLRPEEQDLVNVGLTYEPGQGNWSARIYADNATDEKVEVRAANLFGATRQPAVGPRRLGISLSFSL